LKIPITEIREKSADLGRWIAASRGLTVLETLIAAVILGLVITGVISLLASGDRLWGRRNAVSQALIVAQNDVERIRAAAMRDEKAGDTVCDEEINGIQYELRRTVTGQASDPLAAEQSNPELREISISVRRKDAGAELVKFILVQGYMKRQQ